MSKNTDIRATGASLYFIPVQCRSPLKFGSQTLTHVTCARARLRVRDSAGNSADGWGETPLSVGWAWPGSLAYDKRERAMESFCGILAEAWSAFDRISGHPMEIGHAFIERELPGHLQRFNADRSEEAMPHLAALICCSAFDIALHDAYGKMLDIDVYRTYGGRHMNRDISDYLEPADGHDADFHGLYPADFFVKQPPARLAAWHLVGGQDPLDESELTGDEPDDGYPVLLRDWIKKDGLKCLKVKLRGNDPEWDYRRLVRVGDISSGEGVIWLSADYNCMVMDPAYVNEMLDRLMREHPSIYGMLLYVEQPFPYDMEANRIDVHAVSARKPLFMDESAHDWRFVRLGRSLGWTSVALKTCKTQTGALLSACWAKAHGMTLMVQDLTNPMLAQIPHCRLAAEVGTIMGVETNAMQFYPEASRPEAAVHPGLYARRKGDVDLSTIGGPGFGYRLDKMERALPDPVFDAFGALR